MAKVLKITKPDKTVHVMPLVNKSFYLAYNNRQKPEKRWKVEEIDESEAKNLPFIDDTHLTPSDAVIKTKELSAQLSAKDGEIEALKAQLAALKGGEENDKEETKELSAQLSAKDGEKLKSGKKANK